jgi:acylglycerol lipase
MTWPAERFAAKGLACYALDLRGRGKSEGERFYVEKFPDYLGDVDRLVRHPGLDRRAASPDGGKIPRK